MFRIFHRASRVFVCTAIAFAAAGPARGVQQVSLPPVPVQILGAESLCTSWTPGGPAGAPTLTCVTGGGGPAPFFCSWTNGPPAGAIAPGTAVNLQINCVGGSAPYTYLWTPGNSTAASLSVSPTVTTAFSVTARDSASGTQTLPATVTVSSGGGGGGGGPISCQGFNNTVVLDMDWNNPQQLHVPSLGQSDAIVVRFTTGSSNSVPNYPKFEAAEYGGQTAPRIATLSASPCDFGQPPPLGWSSIAFGSTVDILFSVGPNPFGVIALSPNTPYFFNIKTTGACGSSCGMLIQFSKPGSGY